MMNKKSVYAFIFGGFGIFGLLIGFAAFRQGWFSPTETFYITFASGEGVFTSTPVSISGLKAGAVTQVELSSQNKVTVEIKVQSKFARHIRSDSRATLGRPFIIGERAISISAGNPENPRVAAGATIVGEESLELTDLLSGGRLAPYFQTFTALLDQLRVVVEGDRGPNAVNLVAVYKQAYTSLRAVESMSKDVNSVRREIMVTPESKKIMRDFAASSDRLEALLTQSQQALPAVTKLTQSVAELMPQLTKTLQDTSFTMQAMQRTFLLSGGVKKLKKEQDEGADKVSGSQSSERAPASE